MTEQAHELALAVAQTLDAKKAEDIQLIDLAGLSILADCFVVASGQNPQQVHAMCDEVLEMLKKRGMNAVRMDGYNAGRWVVMDLGDVIVHVFHQEERAFYHLERLWNDGTNTTVYAPVKE